MSQHSIHSPETVKSIPTRKNATIQEMKLERVRVERNPKVGNSGKAQCWQNPLGVTIPTPPKSSGPVEFLRCWTSNEAGAKK